MSDFSNYLKQLLRNQPEPLGKDEELALILRAQSGDDDAYSELLSRNMKLVAGVATSFFSDSLEPDDLFQEGCMGFRNAVMKFDPSFHCRLSTYATRWINQAISRMIQDQGRAIRIPEHVQTDKNRLSRAEEEFILKYGVMPTEEELAAFAHMKPEKVKEIRRSLSSIDSLDREINGDGDAVVSDFVEGDDESNPETRMVKKDLMDQLYRGIDSLLTPREQTVIRRRYGLCDTEKATLDEIGKELGLTRERVRQIEKQALDKLSSFSPLQAA